jgi:hypothetical protein
VLLRLRRYGLALAIGLVLATGFGLVAIHGRPTSFGVASKRVLLDTPSSQTVDADPRGIDTLAWRAELVSDLMGDDENRGAIARAAGISADQLVVSAPYMSIPAVPLPLARSASDVASAPPQPYQLAIQAADRLPVIGIDARAPSRAAAGRLADAAATVMTTLAASEAGPDAQPLVLQPIGPAHARAVVDRPRRAMGVGVGAVVFGAWCAALVFRVGLRRRRALTHDGRSALARPLIARHDVR